MNMKTFYAVVEHGKVYLEEKVLPSPGPGELLLQAEFSTLSPGTENGLMHGYIVPLPTNIGYSMAATVVETGEGVTDYRAGDVVVTTGEHAQYLIMHELNVTPAPEGIDLEQAAFFNLGHTGMYALRRSNLQLGEAALVMGQGFVGAVTAQCAKSAGALPIIVTDLDDGRLETARQMGIDYAINPEKNPDELQGLIDSLGWGGIPVIFEATGSRKPLQQAFDLVSERGRIVMISQSHDEVAMNYEHQLMMKGASLIGTYINSKPFKLKRADLIIDDRWPPVINRTLNRYVNSDIWTSDEDIRVFLNMINCGRIDIRPLISHRWKYDEIASAYEKVWELDPSVTGGLISWR
jgi:NADPH2:quinone reductase